MVDDWFAGFLAEHLARHSGFGLPVLGSEEGVVLFASWRKVFIERGIHDLDVATAASERLTGETLKYPREHFPRLVELAIEVYKTRNAAQTNGIEADSIEAARLISADCPHCSGQGMTTVYHPQPDPVNRVPESVSAHCVCPAGRWIRRRIGETDAILLRRIPDLADVIERRTAWLLEMPGADDYLDASGDGFALIRRLSASFKAERTDDRGNTPLTAPEQRFVGRLTDADRRLFHGLTRSRRAELMEKHAAKEVPTPTQA